VTRYSAFQFAKDCKHLTPELSGAVGVRLDEKLDGCDTLWLSDEWLGQRKAHATDEPKLTSFVPHTPAALHGLPRCKTKRRKLARNPLKQTRRTTAEQTPNA
jgi:hypothetical protein